MRHDAECPDAASGAGKGCNHVPQPKLAPQRFADKLGDPLAAALLIRGIGEFALDQDGIQSHAVGRGEYLSASDIRSRGGARAGEECEQTRMIGSMDGESVMAVNSSVVVSVATVWPLGLASSISRA